MAHSNPTPPRDDAAAHPRSPSAEATSSPTPLPMVRTSDAFFARGYTVPPVVLHPDATAGDLIALATARASHLVDLTMALCAVGEAEGGNVAGVLHGPAEDLYRILQALNDRGAQ